MPDSNKIVGRTISGDITWSDQNDTPQVGVKEFLHHIDAILNHPLVESVKWDQYTPYFMDGDACVFGVNDIRVRTVGTPEDSDEGDYEDGYIDTWDFRYRDDKEKYTDLVNTIGQHWMPAAFEKVCLANFGDHAEVIATKDGFSVEYYEHD